MRIDQRTGERCPVITHEDSPDLVYAAVRDLHYYRRLSMARREDVEDGLFRMRFYFDLDVVGNQLKEPNTKLPGLTIHIPVDDLELALVGLGCFTLDHRNEQAEEVIPKVDALLAKIDTLREVA